MIRITAILAVLLTTTGAFAQSGLQAQYAAFLENTIWPAARSADVSRATFDRAMSGKTLNTKIPGLVTPGSSGTPRKMGQAEFSAPANYFNESNLGSVAATGRSLARKHASTLAAVERRYGVPGRIVLAIWGRESGFGRVNIPHDAFEVLGTKAFMSTRPELFQAELVAALQMVERGMATPGTMRSSWAGALGQPQFLPSSYLKHAVDFDGDGRADIWNSVPDTLASIAAYLKTFGWQSGRDWGFEVTVPEMISCSMEGPDRGMKIAHWADLGIKRVSGKPFPADERGREGFLLMPAGRSGPAFIVTPNFYVLKEYNESDLYALFVGHAGDRIQWGDSRFSGGWKRTDPLLRSDIAAMQRVLESRGYDVGGADGLPGFKTRRSIGEWQLSNGRAPSCFPSSSLVSAIR
ncbi:lytic murein transglycosylase [Oricola cellulosilytica]|uniref:Lytic murein transglycosylase n=1 Tax=Oricola cellulosilytica TaxID=1429082 RepID=A0A4R0PJ54_9HYPH|nr:lytic murein transglycosylase [Oricola cellulosilytica]TCD16460.1 lytic murein transglycosylase [Oricola cellulosilytica]